MSNDYKRVGMALVSVIALMSAALCFGDHSGALHAKEDARTESQDARQEMRERRQEAHQARQKAKSSITPTCPHEKGSQENPPLPQSSQSRDNFTSATRCQAPKLGR